SVGRLVEKKGTDVLLEALAQLPPELHWRRVHIGGGPLKAQLERLAAARGIAGRITWRGALPQPEVLAALRAEVGMVFQSFNLFPHMNALQNVMEAPVQVLGLSKAEARERAEELLAMVGLEDKLEHFPVQLSGGQQQRVAIARALAMRPKVMLFDEVTSALDPELCGEVLNVIRRLGDAHNLTMLMVTHQMGFAREFADRVCFFHQGRIHEQGSPDELFNNPREERTREFLSAVNEAH
ncbi:MAG: ATP-binding cassette domain-containing protein, partial [Gammaproteobacteria bacterium]